MFKKNLVYDLNGKYVCVLVDSTYACLVPIVAHKKDNGYSLKLSKPVLYAPSFDLAYIDPMVIGSIRDGIYYKKQK